MNIKFFGTILLCTLLLSAHSQEKWTSGRPDGHAPMTVMGDHTHAKGGLMVSYRFSHMFMDGLLDGTTKVSEDAALATYMMVPSKMDMRMHMLGLMYAVSDNLTLMLMTNYIQLQMDMSMKMVGSEMQDYFETESSGFGDLKISGLYQLMDTKDQRIHANIGVSIPIGTINNEDVTPMSDPNATQLPYPMQLGSGTWDLLPGITYLGQSGSISWGAQTIGTIRLGENDRGYTWGNKGGALGWIAYKTTEWLSLSAKIDGCISGQISGSDEALTNQMMAPTVDPDNFGGTNVKGGFGFNIYIPNGAFKNVRFGLEYEIPFYQNLNGPQMRVKNKSTLGLQYSW